MFIPFLLNAKIF